MATKKVLIHQYVRAYILEHGVQPRHNETAEVLNIKKSYVKNVIKFLNRDDPTICNAVKQARKKVRYGKIDHE